MKKKGFTLVELLAVIAILAILVIMALPAVLKMFTQARIDTFNNELNTVIRTTRQQYLLSGGEASTYSKDSNPLSLTGNSNLDYCITINGEGQITDFKATNGSYKYESNGIVNETSSSDILNAESGYTLTCSGGNTSSITYVNRQTEGSITVGDEVAIDTEHFYVISTDSTNTVLFAKYNLLVGDVYNSSDGGSTWTFTKTLTTSDAGYGLQSEVAKGHYSGATDYTGVVAFSGKAYWDNANCVSNGSATSITCSGTHGLKSEYTNESNTEGTIMYRDPNPYVYRNDMSTVAPIYTYGSPWGYAQDNGYTIAYYVERYVNTLKHLGAPNTITGRLLSQKEIGELPSSMKAYNTFWSGTAGDYMRVDANYTVIASSRGVRPAIIIPTSDMPA